MQSIADTQNCCVVVKPKNDHPYLRRDKGAIVQLEDKCAFMKPGNFYTDPRGRKYLVAEDGSIRRMFKKKIRRER